ISLLWELRKNSSFPEFVSLRGSATNDAVPFESGRRPCTFGRSAVYCPRGRAETFRGNAIMMPRAALLTLFALLIVPAVAGAADGPLVLDVWPGKVPGETGNIGPEKEQDQKPGEKLVKRLTNVSKPTISVFRPAKDKDTGAAVVICPGGGYSILAWDLE